MDTLKSKIRDVPDFPKAGIIFKDITTLLKDGDAYFRSIEELAARFNADDIDKVLGVESRGFIFAAALAYKWKKGLVLVRKPGKLPGEKLLQKYELEYGTDAVEIHLDAIQKGERVLVVDDLLATGGTISAAVKLTERLGGKVIGIGFLIELTFLNGRNLLNDYRVESLIQYDVE
ncbi:adenine phosphoribosyltransferase [candidate division KSB1 bacterium 4484_87]|nr:MAG: adenine phosphoribosyltransferase [candidate division KSB1 bacterium 4484_87]